MQVVDSHDGLYYYTKVYYYYTPRALLIQHLENNKSNQNDLKLPQNEVELYERDIRKLSEIWKNQTTNGFRNGYEQYRHYNWNIVGYMKEAEYYDDNLSSGKYTLATKSTDRRFYVNDLIVGSALEWIIRFLLEQSRIDWTQWEDKNALIFRILDIDGIAKVYSEVNKIKLPPVYAFKMLLSSYCRSGIMTQVGDKKYQYQFDKEIYAKELSKKHKEAIEYYRSPKDLAHISLVQYPQTTKDRRCCQ